MGVKVLCGYHLEHSIFNELYWCCLQQWSLAASLWRATYCLDNSLRLFLISVGPCQPKLNWMKPSPRTGSLVW